jgi:hypothetical protein
MPLAGAAEAPGAPSKAIPPTASIVIRIMRIPLSICHEHPLGAPSNRYAIPDTRVNKQTAKHAGPVQGLDPSVAKLPFVR